jgi:hypothetical protein
MPGVEIAVDRPDHGGNRAGGIVGVAQRRENMDLEPAVDLSQHLGGHLRFAAWKEMIEAALAEAGGLADQRQRGAFITVRAKHLRQPRQ